MQYLPSAEVAQTIAERMLYVEQLQNSDIFARVQQLCADEAKRLQLPAQQRARSFFAEEVIVLLNRAQITRSIVCTSCATANILTGALVVLYAQPAQQPAAAKKQKRQRTVIANEDSASTQADEEL